MIFMPRPIRGLGRLRRPQGKVGEQCLHVSKSIQQPTGSSGWTIIAILCSTSVAFIKWFGPAARSNPLVGYSWVTHGNTQDGLLLGPRRRKQRSNANNGVQMYFMRRASGDLHAQANTRPRKAVKTSRQVGGAMLACSQKGFNNQLALRGQQ